MSKKWKNWVFVFFRLTFFVENLILDNFRMATGFTSNDVNSIINQRYNKIKILPIA